MQPEHDPARPRAGRAPAAKEGRRAGSRARPRRMPLSADGEREARLDGRALADGHVLRLRAELLVPGLDDVVAWAAAR